MKVQFLLLSLLFITSFLSTAVHADETARVSPTSTDEQGNDDSGTGPVHAVAISGDGTRVVFVASATNHVPGDTNGKQDVFVRDITAGTTVRASVSTAGAQGDDDSYLPRISSQGRYVVFQGFSSTLVMNDTNGFSDVFVRDLMTGTTVRESVSSSEVQGNLNSESGSISADGRYLAFWSNASNLDSDTNGTGDIFLRDRQAGTTARMSLGAGGAQSNGNSGATSISADGAELAFSSLATNLVTGDTNDDSDVFLRIDTPEPIPYCFGVTTCPCFNPGSGQEGCANSSGSGAALGWSGSTSASADDLVLEAHDLLPNQPALAFVGLAWINNGNGAPFGDGLRCAANSVIRLGVETPNAQGDANYGPGLGATGGWNAGDLRYFQVWYRDPVGGSCGTGFNLTNGLQVLFGT